MPTVFEFLGHSVPEKYKIQGLSLQAQLEKPQTRALATEAFPIRGHKFFKFFTKAQKMSPDKMREAFKKMSEDDSYAPKVGIEKGPLKLVYDTWLTQAWVYDLAKDPLERKDIRADDESRAASMDQVLDDWRRTQTWVLEELTKL